MLHPKGIDLDVAVEEEPALERDLPCSLTTQQLPIAHVADAHDGKIALRARTERHLGLALLRNVARRIGKPVEGREGLLEICLTTAPCRFLFFPPTPDGKSEHRQGQDDPTETELHDRSPKKRGALEKTE